MVFVVVTVYIYVKYFAITLKYPYTCLLAQYLDPLNMNLCAITLGMNENFERHGAYPFSKVERSLSMAAENSDVKMVSRLKQMSMSRLFLVLGLTTFIQPNSLNSGGSFPSRQLWK